MIPDSAVVSDGGTDEIYCNDCVSRTNFIRHFCLTATLQFSNLMEQVQGTNTFNQKHRYGTAYGMVKNTFQPRQKKPQSTVWHILKHLSFLHRSQFKADSLPTFYYLT